MFVQELAAQDFPLCFLFRGHPHIISDHQDDFGFRRLSLTISFPGLPIKLLAGLSYRYPIQLLDSINFQMIALSFSIMPWVMLCNSLNQIKLNTLAGAECCPSFRLAPSFHWVDAEDGCSVV